MTFVFSLRNSALAAAAVLTAALTAALGAGSAARAAAPGMAAIYGGGPFYSGGNSSIQSTINDLKASGFTRVIGWSVHIGSNGDLIYNDPTIVSNGAYVGDSAWGGYLSQLKQAPTGVTSVALSLGAWGTSDFANIASLINSQGTGSGSILYRNFQALKNALPAVDTIDFDDEDDYDQNAVVQLSLMLGSLGYHVTYCPYTNQGFWINCLSSVNSQSPGLVTAFNLQCYEGGAGNDPANWQNAIYNAGQHTPVYPGLELPNGSAVQSENQFASWASSEGIHGGFYWIYDSISGNGQTNAYADAIEAGILAGHSWTLMNQNSGLALDVPNGSTSWGLQMQQWQEYALGEESWKFNYVGNGLFTIANTANGLVLDDWQAGTAPGTMVDQYGANQTNAQNWSLTLNADGSFRVFNQASGLCMAVNGMSTSNGGQITQWTDNGTADHNWSMVENDINTAYGPTVLTPGQELVNGSHAFIMQVDGNLVEYNGTTPIWASGTYGNPGATCAMQNDGNLVVYNASGGAIWASGTWGHPGAYVTLQSDGNVVIYAPSGGALWATGTNGR